MTTRAVRTEDQRQSLIKLIESRQLPFSAQINKGAPRSIEQNYLQRKWLSEAQEQGDQTAEEYRGYCKLHFGVAIMKSESPEWAEKYDRLIKPLSYPEKLEMMMEPMDFPVTRLMSTKGKTDYLDQMYQHFTGLGFILTDPNLRGMDEYRKAVQ